MRRHSIPLACPICGKSFTVAPSSYRHGHRCCSRACSTIRRHRNRRPAEERFWEKVLQGGPDECWLWQGGKMEFGYGMFFPSRGRTVGAHRFAWILTHGPIPAGLQVCHNCPGGDNPGCVNPAHLFLGTQGDNNRDTFRKGRNSRHVPPPMPGERHPMARLTEEQVRSILSRPQEARAVLAAEFGVTVATIKKIRGRQVWRHLP